METRVIAILTTIVLASSAAFAAKPAAERPNVILIYADDLGIGLLGSCGQQLIKTPNIDRLEKEGIQFNNYYGGVLCAPARFTLLTGMHDGRIGGWDVSGSAPIPDNEVFLGQVAQQAG